MAWRAPIKTGLAWQPITPRGIAAFAETSLARLIVCQIVFAALTGFAIAWFFSVAVFPVVRNAIQHLPLSGEVRGAQLAWKHPSPVLLSDGRVLAVAVDLDHTGRARVPADLFIEFGRDSWRTISIAGYTEWKYRRGVIMSFNRTELEPWWGAWRVPILGLLLLGTTLLLPLVWAGQAALYIGPARLLAFYTSRKTRLSAVWKVCAAAMMPASLILCMAFFFYAQATLNLIGFGLMLAGHMVAGCVLVVLGVLALPRDPSVLPIRKNPFASPPRAAK